MKSPSLENFQTKHRTLRQLEVFKYFRLDGRGAWDMGVRMCHMDEPSTPLCWVAPPTLPHPRGSWDVALCLKIPELEQLFFFLLILPTPAVSCLQHGQCDFIL